MHKYGHRQPKTTNHLSTDLYHPIIYITLIPLTISNHPYNEKMPTHLNNHPHTRNQSNLVRKTAHCHTP